MSVSDRVYLLCRIVQKLYVICTCVDPFSFANGDSLYMCIEDWAVWRFGAVGTQVYVCIKMVACKKLISHAYIYA